MSSDKNVTIKKEIHRRFQYVLCIFLTVLSFSTVLSGCAGMDVRAIKAREALEEKYGEKFRVTEVHKFGSRKDYFTADAHAVAWPGLPFVISMDMNDGTFQDGYVMKRGTQLMAERASQNLGGLKNGHYVHVQSFFPDSVKDDPDMSLDEYISSESINSFTIYLYIDPSGETPESISQAVSHIMDGMSPAQGSVEIFFADKVVMDKARRYVENHAVLESGYSKIGKDKHVVRIHYKYGNLELDQDAIMAKLSENM